MPNATPDENLYFYLVSNFETSKILSVIPIVIVVLFAAVALFLAIKKDKAVLPIIVGVIGLALGFGSKMYTDSVFKDAAGEMMDYVQIMYELPDVELIENSPNNENEMLVTWKGNDPSVVTKPAVITLDHDNKTATLVVEKD